MSEEDETERAMANIVSATIIAITDLVEVLVIEKIINHRQADVILRRFLKTSKVPGLATTMNLLKTRLRTYRKNEKPKRRRAR
jgi:hypothetical protein